MSTTTKIQHKGQVTIPTHLRKQAGLDKGDLVEFSYSQGKLILTPQVVIDRSKFPNADDEYPPAQRRIIDARLAEADEDIKQGRTHGPFDTADEMIAHMKEQLKKPSPAKNIRRTR